MRRVHTYAQSAEDFQAVRREDGDGQGAGNLCLAGVREGDPAEIVLQVAQLDRFAALGGDDRLKRIIIRPRGTGGAESQPEATE